MKPNKFSKWLLQAVIFTLISGFHGYSQIDQNNFTTYSYKELFEMIESETDSIFELSDALIEFKWTTDREFVIYTTRLSDEVYSLHKSKDSVVLHTKPKKVVDIPLYLENVQFKRFGEIKNDSLFGESGLFNLIFKQEVNFFGVKDFSIRYCQFEKPFSVGNLSQHYRSEQFIEKQEKRYDFTIDGNVFHTEVRIQLFNQNEGGGIDQYGWFTNNKFYSKYHPNTDNFYRYDLIFPDGIKYIDLSNNTFFNGMPFRIPIRNVEAISFENNIIHNRNFSVSFAELNDTNGLVFSDNEFERLIILEIEEFKSIFQIDWWQLQNGFINSRGLFYEYNISEFSFTEKDSLLLTEYDKQLKIENEESFLSEAKLLSAFYNHYKGNFDSRSSNNVYVNIKNLETRRMQYLHNENPSFKTFFRWQINRFLKVFSNYGTEPERAIIFSFYVILLFAGIYLFFPNTWDEHGRKRIMDRYAFFIKYMKRDSGIHEVYLEEKQKDLLEYEEFKTMIQESGKSIPRFFLTTGYPLYKWAVLGTKTSVRWLKRFDIVSGKWSDLPDKQRPWKTILLVGAFIVALAYDLLIKVLNALMLSVNTFTTLGFGEIPIKGLPRYLAIIQGFIGWFMLTIFSVSLISQLLLN